MMAHGQPIPISMWDIQMYASKIEENRKKAYGAYGLHIYNDSDTKKESLYTNKEFEQDIINKLENNLIFKELFENKNIEFLKG